MKGVAPFIRKIETTVNIGRGGCMGHLFAKAAKRIRVLQVGP